MNTDMMTWESELGIRFLIELGIEPGNRILDFGARVGHYSIPIARIVGDRGIVYAQDKNSEALNELDRKAKSLGLNNLHTVLSSGAFELGFADESFDVVLFFDVLHFFKESEREKLYEEARRVLKPDGMLAIYPKHTMDDDPAHETSAVSIDTIIRDILTADFCLERQIEQLVSHDDNLIPGTILLFRKSDVLSG